MNKLPYLFLLYFFLPYSLFCQLPFLQHYTVEDDLPSSNVYTTYQDSSGMMWFGTDMGLTSFDGYRFKSYDMTSINASNDIWGINGDEAGRLWFSSMKQISYLENNEFKSIPFPKQYDLGKIERYFIDKKNHFVEFENSRFLFELDKEKKALLQCVTLPETPASKQLVYLLEDALERKWFVEYGHAKVNLFYTENEKLVMVDSCAINAKYALNYVPFPTNENQFILFDYNAYLLIDVEKGQLVKNDIPFSGNIFGNQRMNNGLVVLQSDQGYIVVDEKLQVQEDLNFLDRFIINDLYKDRTGNLWICTRNDGIYFLPKNNRLSQTILSTGNKLRSDITAVAIDLQNRVWLANKATEIIIVDHGKQHTIQVEVENVSRTPFYFDDLTFDDQGNLFIGANEGALIIVPAFRLDELMKKQKWRFSLNDLGNIWLSKKQTFKKDFLYLSKIIVKSINSEGNRSYITSAKLGLEVSINDSIHVALLSKTRAYTSAYWKGQLWIGRQNGLYVLNENGVEQIVVDFPHAISNLSKSENDKLWIATQSNGLYRYDWNTIDTITPFINARTVVRDMTITKDGEVLVGTNKGLAILEVQEDQPLRYSYKMLNKSHGLLTDETNAVHINGDNIYVATPKGLTILDKEEIPTFNPKHPLFFTQLTINNSVVEVQEEMSLPHDDNNLKIEFVSLSYSDLGRIEYEYKMEGIDREWNTTEAQYKEYSTLPPGEYTFIVRAKNLNGIISDEQKIKLIIQLPWWKTFWAISMAALILLGTVYLIFKFKLKQTQDRAEKHKLEELTQIKSKLYSNVTHEFRTPLTLILGVVEKMESTFKETNIESYTSAISRHSKRLLNLTNQLLELNRVESDTVPLNYKKGEVVQFIEHIVNLFRADAEKKEIQLIFYSEHHQLEMDFDSDKLQSILFNLLSNAIRHTKSQGKVVVHLKSIDQNLHIKVKDTGIGIGTEALTLIFNRFYQEKSNNGYKVGSGIGLALVKELTEKMNGNVAVESSEEGTIFYVNLPLNQATSEGLINIEDWKAQPIVKSYLPTESDGLIGINLSQDDSKSKLLIVEDDPELLTFIHSVLCDFYKVIIAEDGQSAVNMAIEEVPDLIISDVKLPLKDGFTLCKQLKRDNRTSHIPIILLTAKVTKKDEQIGLSVGADVFMRKPFSIQTLYLQINQLLANRQKLRLRYKNGKFPKEKVIPRVGQEDIFIAKVRQIIENHMDKDDLDVHFLCKKLFMSRTQLHNKLTFLTGLSTTKFINTIRLEHAQRLLKETNLKVSEVAHSTGYEVKYFSKIFTQIIGVSPSNYRKKQ